MKTKETLFHEFFKVTPRKLFSPGVGFDVIRFDEEYIKPPDGVSTAQHIEALHGPTAASMVRELLSIFHVSDFTTWLFAPAPTVVPPSAVRSAKTSPKKPRKRKASK